MHESYSELAEGETLADMRVIRAASLAAFLQLLALRFDRWHDRWLASLSNFQLIAGVVLLLVIAHLVTAALFWHMSAAVPEWMCQTMGALTAIAFGAPVAAFGCLEYRRAHASRRRFQRVVRQLIAARDEAERASRAKSHFLASMSHELRTPLNAIIGFSEILKTGAFGPIGIPRYAEYAADIFTSGQHLLSLVNDILDLSKIESGVEHLKTDTRIDLASKIRAVCRSMTVIANGNAVLLTPKLPAESVHILANKRMMTQVLMNLISNAIKFSKAGGTVTVSLTHGESRDVIVAVADTGPGMTEQEAELALQPFSQIHSHQSRKHDGTGLGLPLTKAMVELHGGRLTLSSKPGFGTTVRFTIPNVRMVAKTIDISAAA